MIPKVILDVFWKSIWAAITLLLIAFFSFWIYREMGAIELNGPVSALQNPLTLMMLTRELWNTYASRIGWLLLSLAVASFTVWILLECYFRAWIFSPSTGTVPRKSREPFYRFLALRCAKLLLIAEAGALLAVIVLGRFPVAPFGEWRGLWSESRASFVVSIVILAVFWFVLTTLETLARSGAVRLLGPFLFDITTVFVGLWLVDWLLFFSVVSGLLIVAHFLPVSGAVLLAALAVFSVVLLSISHSCLVAARFKFVSTLQRDTEATF